jgi:hypothetical protein
MPLRPPASRGCLVRRVVRPGGWRPPKGVDVFDPARGEVRSDGAEGIACWFVDTDYRAVAVMACDDEVIPSQQRIKAVGETPTCGRSTTPSASSFTSPARAPGTS